MCGIRWMGVCRIVCSIGVVVLLYCGSSYILLNGVLLNMCFDGFLKIGVLYRFVYMCL